MSRPITTQQRRDIRSKAEESQRLAEAAYVNIVRARHQLEAQKVDHDAEVLNALEFVLLLQFDISCLLSDLVSYENGLRPVVYSRFLLLTIVEATKQMRSLLRPSFQRQIMPALGAEYDASILRDVHSAVSKLYRDCVAEFGDVRDGIVGHRDPNANTRERLLSKSSDLAAVTQLTLRMQDILNTLAEAFASYTKTLATAHREQGA